MSAAQLKERELQILREALKRIVHRETSEYSSVLRELSALEIARQALDEAKFIERLAAVGT